MGVGLTTLPRKNPSVTETLTTNHPATIFLGAEGSSDEDRMTFCGESQMMETTAPTTLLTTKKPLKIGTWNVRTLFESGKAAQVAIEMNRYHLSILGLCETRWTQSGKRRLATGEVILYSGHEEEDAAHTEGVALMLGKEAQKALLGWEARGPRLMTASFKTSQKKIKMNVILAYAPTNTNTEETKDEFYEQLEAILNETKDKDVNILIGDFNAKVGNDNEGYENCMGKHGLGIMNENGELLQIHVPYTTLLLEEQCFHTRRYIRVLGFHQTTLQSIRSTIFVSTKSSDEVFLTSRQKEVQMYFLTII